MSGSGWRWWYFVLAGLALAGLSLFEYHDLAQKESKGGTIYLNKFVALIYDVAGKTGVLIFGFAISSLIIVAGLRVFTLKRRAAMRERGQRKDQ